MEGIRPETESKKFELSHEQLEIVMAKVQDINEPETGLHSISQHSQSEEGLNKRLSNLEAELKDGILGQHNRGESIDNREEWIKKAKDREGLFLYFNIIGREIKGIKDSFWMWEGIRQNPVALIFDYKNFKEVDIEDFTHTYDETGNNRRPALDIYPTKTFGRNGTSSGNLPGFDMGYALNFRVSPRFFKGVVFRVDRKSIDEDFKEIEAELSKKYEEPLRRKYGSDYEMHLRHAVSHDMSIYRNTHKYFEVTDEAKMQERVDEIVAVMLNVNKDKPDRLLPVYDIHGNMWWPKRMTYEEVIKLKTESTRDTSI